MKLTFLGRGAGFYPDEGSTSAFFIDKGELFLIDSGESVFHSLLKKKIFNSVSAVNIFITHTHSDHVGSLGSVVLYAFAVKKLAVKIITDRNMAYLSSLRSVLKIFGITENMFQFADAASFSGGYSLFNRVSYVKTTHCNELKSCGILFETDQGVVFYSGDMNDMAPLVKIINSGQKIDKLYLDSNNDRKPNMHHISIHQLNDIIPQKLKSKVHCMHFNSEQCIADAKAYGFKAVGNL